MKGGNKPKKTKTKTKSSPCSYYAIGFGSNYFHQFSDYAICLHDVEQQQQQRQNNNQQSVIDANNKAKTSQEGQEGQEMLKANENKALENEYENENESNNKSISSALLPRGYFFPLSADSNTKMWNCTSDITTCNGKTKTKLSSPENATVATNTTMTTKTTKTTRKESMLLPYPLKSSSSSSSSKIPSISLGKTHAITLTHTGQIYQSGTLNGKTYPKLTRISTQLPLKCTQLACGDKHIIALFERRVTMTWGSNLFGQLGHGMSLNSDNTYAYSSSGGGAGGTGGTTSSGGGNGNRSGADYYIDCESPKVVERLLRQYVGGDVVRVEAGGMHSSAIVATDGSWDVEYGKEATIPTITTTTTTTSSSSKTKSAKEVRTRVFQWGNNRYGQCAILTLEQLKKQVKKQSTSNNHVTHSTVGYPMPMIDVSHPDTGKRVYFVALTLGKRFSIGLTSRGEVYSWGSSAAGRCGHGDLRSGRSSTARIVPRRIDSLQDVTIVQICAGEAHTLALSDDGTMYSWGSGGALGQGHNSPVLNPQSIILDQQSQEGESRRKEVKDITTSASIEEEEEDSKVSSLPSSPTTTPPPIDDESESENDDSTKIISVHAAGNSSAAITADGDLYTWGCSDGDHLGHVLPASTSELPNVEPGCIKRAASSERRISESKSFDSRFNILIPQRVDYIRKFGLKVEDVALGSSSSTIVVCSDLEK